eukprot:6746927-Lingulodinium_polyedra.AAC.1
MVWRVAGWFGQTALLLSPREEEVRLRSQDQHTDWEALQVCQSYGTGNLFLKNLGIVPFLRW